MICEGSKLSIKLKILLKTGGIQKISENKKEFLLKFYKKSNRPIYGTKIFYEISPWKSRAIGLEFSKIFALINLYNSKINRNTYVNNC